MQDYKKLYGAYADFNQDESEPPEAEEAEQQLRDALRLVHNQDTAQAIDLAVGRLLRIHEVEGFTAGCRFMREVRSILEGD